MRAAASRTFCTAGRSKPIRMAIIAMTTNSSIRVKPLRGRERDGRMPKLRKDEEKKEQSSRTPERTESNENESVASRVCGYATFAGSVCNRDKSADKKV